MNFFVISFRSCLGTGLRGTHDLLLNLKELSLDSMAQGGLAGSFRDEDLHAALGASQEHELALAARWKTLYWMIALAPSIMTSCDSMAIEMCHFFHVFPFSRPCLTMQVVIVKR